MTLTVFTVWVIYIVVFVTSVVVLILFDKYIQYYRSLHYGMIILIASIIGLVAAIIATLFLTKPVIEESGIYTWLILFFVAFVIPIVSMLYVVYSNITPENKVQRKQCCH